MKMIKILSLFVWIFLPLFSMASLLPSSGIRCEKEIEAILRTETFQGEWKELISTSEKKRFIRGTQNFGKWVYVEWDGAGLMVSQQSQFEMLNIEFDSKCEKKLGYAHQEKSSFTGMHDGELADLVGKNQDLLIFVWSPEMPLSMTTLPQVQKFAEQKNIPLKVLLYRNSSPELARKVASIEKYPKHYLTELNSFHLSMLGVESHQPSVFRFKNGQLLGSPLFGFKITQEYLEYYQKMGSK